MPLDAVRRGLAQQYETRVQELLEANNALVERARKAEREAVHLRIFLDQIILSSVPAGSGRPLPFEPTGCADDCTHPSHRHGRPGRRADEQRGGATDA